MGPIQSEMVLFNLQNSLPREVRVWSPSYGLGTGRSGERRRPGGMTLETTLSGPVCAFVWPGRGTRVSPGQ